MPNLQIIDQSANGNVKEVNLIFEFWLILAGSLRECYLTSLSLN